MFREESAATQQLAAIPIKENVYAITGPLGQPSVCTKKVGLVVCVASGLGVGQILPVVRQLTKLGNKVIGVIGAKNRRELLLEPQIRLACHKIHTVTNESVIKGGELGMVNQILDQQPINMVYAAGSVEMMQSLAVKTKEKKVPFFIQVYPMMCCGMGFCGSCRMRVNNQIILACEEGPEFDGHKVDFADLRLRLNAYEKTERALAPARKLEVTSSSGPVQRDKFSKFFTDLLKS
jgi:ferredoxin--NADP+ reductase